MECIFLSILFWNYGSNNTVSYIHWVTLTSLTILNAAILEVYLCGSLKVGLCLQTTNSVRARKETRYRHANVQIYAF